jgi:copper homeostasis protein
MSGTRGFELEVCVDTFADALRGCQAGATRLEWNQALDLDGLTPTVSSCRWLVRNLDVPVLAMIRPHNRGFVYTEQELACMFEDCRAIVDAGVAGIVFGALNSGGEIDYRALEKMSTICEDVELVFHKAFDCLSTRQQVRALPELRSRGVKRILTSGGKPTVSEGADQLKQLCQDFSGDSVGDSDYGKQPAGSGVKVPGRGCEILAGGGVRPDGILPLYEKTGCRQYHGSFRFGAAELNVNEVRRAAATLKELQEGEIA